jgi:DNA-binding NarL/FixJ family response regulator
MRTSTDSPPDGTGATRIMIIDDHEISRAASCALLRTEGLHVAADLRTSTDVLEAARALHPDLVIIDVTPATDTGFTIARRLRALPSPPIVILTSSADYAQFGTQLNGYRFLAKADISAAAIASLTSTPAGPAL